MENYRGTKHIWKMGDKAVRLKRKDDPAETHSDNKENKLKVTGCHVLEQCLELSSWLHKFSLKKPVRLAGSPQFPDL